jgi:hypothetical protein
MMGESTADVERRRETMATVETKIVSERQVIITSVDRDAAKLAAERYMDENVQFSWKIDPVSVGRHGGAYVTGYGFCLTGEAYQAPLAPDAATAIAVEFLDRLDGRYALWCVLSYGIAFTTDGDALRDAHCYSNYKLIASEIDRLGRERYQAGETHVT